MLLDIMANFLIYNNDDEVVLREFTDRKYIDMEEICMSAVKYSLELANVPIKKFLIIFHIYMRLLFGNQTKKVD